MSLQSAVQVEMQNRTGKMLTANQATVQEKLSEEIQAQQSQFCRLDKGLSGVVINHLSAKELNVFTQVNKECNQLPYSKTNSHVFHLDLTKYETVDRIQSILKKLSSVDKIKITGLNKKGKLELFNEALSKLSNVTFNTFQCDLSRNQLTADQFKQINTTLLSKMPKLTSLDLSYNHIGDEGATAIATNLTGSGAKTAKSLIH